MTAYRAPGMDHDLYRYSAIKDRPPLAWPGGARVAFAPVVYLEHWELDPPAGSLRDPRFIDPFGDFRPDIRTHTWREYGARIGIFRIFEAFDRYSLTASVAASAAALARYPQLVEECLRRGWEFVAHGTHATRMVSSAMTEDEERAVIAESVAAVERATGRRPTGWISQDFGQTPRTPQLLAEAGLRYLADWPNDDQPYRMTTTPPLLSIPCQSELDDVQLLWHRRVLSPRYPGLVGDALRVLHAEAGRCLNLGLHPWLMGMPHRIRYLDQALAGIAGQDGVWNCTLGAIADHLGERHDRA